MGEPAKALEQAERRALPPRRAWVLAIVAAGLSRNARHAARYIASLDSFPYAFFSVADLGEELGVLERQARRVLRELSEAGFLERWASWRDDTGMQRQNDYVCVLPGVGQERTFDRVVMDDRPLRAEGEKRERRGRERKAAAARTHVRAREAVPPAAASQASSETGQAPAVARERAQQRASAPREGLGREKNAQNPPPPKRSPLAASGRLAPDVFDRLGRLPDWEDAVPFLERAQFTPDEQRRVLDKLERMKPEHAGRACHGPIRDVLKERDREAEAEALTEPLPDLAGVDYEHCENILRELSHAHLNVRSQDPPKARVLMRQIVQVRKHLGIHDVSPPKRTAAITHEEAQRRDKREGRAAQAITNPKVLELLKRLESPP